MHAFATSALRRLSAALLIAATMLVGTASPALAHTGFESSEPAEGQSIDQPVSEISLTFSGEATPAGEGIVVLDPSGQLREPDEILSEDNLTWTARFDEPLVGGVVGVRWKVAAPDAHPIEGSFSFTVTAEAPAATTTSTTGLQATTTPSTTVAPTAEEAAATTQPEQEVAQTAESESEAPPRSAGNDEGGAVVASGTDSAASVDLDSFLETGNDEATGASWLFRASRMLRLFGAVGVIGGAAFSAFVLRGDKGDVEAVLRWVRRAGLLLVVASVGAAVAQIATLESSWSALGSLSAWKAALWSSLGLAIAGRLVGGALVATGTTFDTRVATTARDPIVAVKQLATVGSGPSISVPTPADPAGPQGTEPYVHNGDHAWHPTTSPAAFVGITLIIVSFLFDGHTVSEGPRWLHALANLTHVVTTATWAGGVVMLALVIARRRRSDVSPRSLQLAVRFSVVATVALLAAALAGIVLSIVILDSPSQLWSTGWGQTLLVKVALVAIAAAGGAYNHKVVVPELERAPDDTAIIDRFRTVVTIEAIALAAVTIATALLIGASAT